MDGVNGELTTLLLRGIVLGLSIAAPVGPIGVLTIRRTLADGRLHGLVSGLGAATADLIYGAITALGLTTLSGALVAQERWVRLGGGLFLLYLGVRTLLSRPADTAAQARSGGLWAAYGSALLLTLTNPLTILLFASIMAGLGLVGAGGGLLPAGTLVLGVFAGSALWWLALSTVVSLVRNRFTPGAMRWVNRISGLVIIAFGLYALFGLLR